MKFAPEDLERNLAMGLPPVTLIEGDETLLTLEAADKIRALALTHGFEREVLDVGPGFNWARVMEARTELSLFAQDSLLELRMPKSKLDVKADKALSYYLEDPPPQKKLIIQCPKVEIRAKRVPKWVQAIDQAGWWISCPLIYADKFGNWLRGELNQARVQLTPEAFELLLSRVEGNALAARQEVQKLSLFQGEQPLTVDEIAQISAESARYSIFDLIDACLSGNAQRTAQICQTLEAEGAEAMAVASMLYRTIEQLNLGADLGWDKARVPGFKQRVFKACLNRHKKAGLVALNQQALRADRAIKGQSPTPKWLSVTQLALKLASAGALAS